MKAPMGRSFGWVAFVPWFGTVSSAAALSLSDYLSVVREKDSAYRAARVERESGQLSQSRATLLTAPSIYSRLSATHSEENPLGNSLVADSFRSLSGSVGVREEFAFGLSLDARMVLDRYWLNNPTVGGETPFSFDCAAQGRLSLDLELPLWANGLGRGIRARQSLNRAQAQAAEEAADTRLENRMLEAKAIYYRVSSLKQLIEIRTKAQSDADQLVAWTSAQLAARLIDDVDHKQALANQSLRTLDLGRARADLRAAAREFNERRGEATDSVPEALDPLPSVAVIPTTYAPSSQLKIYESQLRAEEAAGRLDAEAARPNLSIFARGSMGALEPGVGRSLEETFKGKDFVISGGVQFDFPLHPSARRRSFASGERRIEAAQKNIADFRRQDRFRFEQGRDQLEELQRQLAVAVELERIQSVKLIREKERFRQGRSTTFQVLSFEQDYADIQAQRIQLALALVQQGIELDRYASGEER